MIKKLILAGLVILTGVALWAASPQVWRSSYTATADVTKNLCGSDAGIITNRRGFLHSVCVTSNTPSTPDLITVYNSSQSAVNIMTVIDGTTNEGCFTYDIVASTRANGLTYSKTGTASVTFMFECY